MTDPHSSIPSERSWSRRHLLKSTLLGTIMGGSSSWFSEFSMSAQRDVNRRKSVILLWLDGGPATIDLWDLKSGHKNGGPFREIETAVPGIRISEHLPKLAKQTREMALIRSVSSREGDHGRAVDLVRTGYSPVGAIQFPAVGSLLAHELERDEQSLPGYVSIAPARNTQSINGGFLGARYSPLRIAEQAETADELTVPNLQRRSPLNGATLAERKQLLEGLNAKFSEERDSQVVRGVQTAASRALRMMSPETAQAFELDGESEELRRAYGRNLFGQGCLLARRLVERGVPCVEVTLSGWDTHQNNFERVAQLSQTLDAGFATLLSDLSDRGLLKETVVVCLGEFGRTPSINQNNGRDHWPRAWSAVMAGGIRGGQLIGSTSEDGLAVIDQPVTIPDLIATLCRTVGIDPTRQNISNVGRPIRIADLAARPIEGISDV